MKLKCLDCKAVLSWPNQDSEMLLCICGKNYPQTLQIPDLRTDQDPYCGNQQDRLIANALVEQFPQKNFRELLDFYYAQFCPELNPDDKQSQVHHILNHSDNLAYFHELKPTEKSNCLLDIGCGTGTALIQARFASPNLEAIGLDVAMRWLILARKRLDEAGLAEIRLVCCNAEQIPFDDSQFHFIHGGDMIEHVPAQVPVFQEVARLLKDGGTALFLTPNRSSFTREPHVGLYFAGWLPRKLSVRYCRLFKAPPWQGIFTHTARGWRRLIIIALGCHNPMNFAVDPAEVGVGNRDIGRFVKFYNHCIRRYRSIRNLARLFGPVLKITMENHRHSTHAPASPFAQAPGVNHCDGQG